MSGDHPAIKWGQQSFLTREMLRDVDRGFIEASLIARCRASATAAGHRPIDGTERVEILDPAKFEVVLDEDEMPEDCLVARVTVRCVEGGAA